MTKGDKNVTQNSTRSVKPIIIEEVKRIPDKDWPVGRTAFKGVVEYSVAEDEDSEPERIFIDYNFEEKYGRRRRFVTVYRKKSKPLAKFIGTDRWSSNRNVIWKLKHNEGKALVRDLQNMPDGYEQFTPVRFRRVVNGPGASACWGVRTKEAPRSLIQIGLLREQNA
jgi:hypothetical protein